MERVGAAFIQMGPGGKSCLLLLLKLDQVVERTRNKAELRVLHIY